MQKHRLLTFRIYQMTAIFSMVFALIGFSYNVWRMEVSEKNSDLRVACFEILLELAALEQTIYHAHYDGDFKLGSPRLAWVKVGLIYDLSVLTNKEITKQAEILKSTWAKSWQQVGKNDVAVQEVVLAIDQTRQAVKNTIKNLK